MDRGNKGDAPRATVLFAEECHERNQGLNRDRQVRDDIPKDVDELLSPFIGKVREKVKGGEVETNGRTTQPSKGPAEVGDIQRVQQLLPDAFVKGQGPKLLNTAEGL